MNYRKSFLSVLLVLILSIALVGCGTEADDNKTQQAETEKGTIKIGYINWAEDVAVSHLWKAILEEEGYNVELMLTDQGPLFSGLAKGDIHLFLDSWLPITDKNYMDKYGDQLDDYGAWYKGEAKVGLAVPTYLENINTISDLEAHKDNFNGEIVGIEPGATMMDIVENDVIPEYNLSLSLRDSSEAAMVAALKSAYSDEQPIVITAWSPHWMFTEFDLKYLEDPKLLLGESEELHTLAHPSFTKDFPKVSTWFKNFSMTEDQLGTLESYMFYQNMKESEAAKKWIEENREVINSWLGK